MRLEKYKIRNISKHQNSLNNITSSTWEDEDIYGSGFVNITDNYNTLLDDISHPINHSSSLFNKGGFGIKGHSATLITSRLRIGGIFINHG